MAIPLGRFLPQVVSGPAWQYATLGVIFALAGSVTTAFGSWRWSAQSRWSRLLAPAAKLPVTPAALDDRLAQPDRYVDPRFAITLVILPAA